MFKWPTIFLKCTWSNPLTYQCFYPKWHKNSWDFNEFIKYLIKQWFHEFPECFGDFIKYLILQPNCNTQTHIHMCVCYGQRIPMATINKLLIWLSVLKLLARVKQVLNEFAIAKNKYNQMETNHITNSFSVSIHSDWNIDLKCSHLIFSIALWAWIVRPSIENFTSDVTYTKIIRIVMLMLYSEPITIIINRRLLTHQL